ncbi:MAG: phosphopantothenoylcysteine decarboxylase [Opitutaceae bacterium]|nr:phosphopantothenoylcysteine decarboxylase [Opitutaceae bacterium]
MAGKTIVLGITGSIAAYKAADLVSQLRKLGASVYPVLTKGGEKFITSLTLQALSRNPVGTSLWDEENGWQPGHIELADKADLLLVAPVTADVLAQFSHGLAPDFLSSLYLACQAPVLLAPAMNGKMYSHPATQANIVVLKERNHHFIGPEEGMLACGYEGIGRLWPVEKIVERVVSLLNPS